MSLLRTIKRTAILRDGVFRTFISYNIQLFSRQFRGTSCTFKTHIAGNNAKRNTTKGQPRLAQKHLQQLVMADAHFIQRQKTGILQVFPNATSTIRNMYNNLSSNLDPSYTYEQSISSIGRVNNQLVFHCTSKIKWPKQQTFQGYGFSKKNAELVTMLKILEMLHEGNYISVNGYPITVSSDEEQELRKKWTSPVSVSVTSALMEEGFRLMETFHKEIKPQMETEFHTSVPSLLNEINDEIGAEESMEEDVTSDDSFCWEDDDTEDSYTQDLFTGRQYVKASSEEILHRSQKMFQRLQEREASKRTFLQTPLLPMFAYRDDLKLALEEKRVLIIAGDTGCGKSTQVPQMILDDWTKEGNGALCNILVTQPRRISAIALAKRVAKERGEKIGESVGYHVRLHYQRLHQKGGVMFCTTGMLLQSLHSNPSLEGVSHVIIDEVHERSVQTDLLLVILRRLLKSSDNLRLILMSASLSTTQLQKYFGEDESELIEVPGALYPLTRHYLPKVFHELQMKSNYYQLDMLTEPRSRPLINYDLIVDVIRSVHKTRPPGAILCFLPGWQDIRTVQTRLEEDRHLEKKLWVLPLHSNLSSGDQEKIFEDPPEGCRKVVLATNLAETSLTVQDVVYVVDTGCHKEQRYDPKKNMSVLGNHWISRANSQQRAGRAGRVQAGEVFHLYSSEVHENMSRFPIPEIMRIPLEHVILQCKAHCGNESVLSFLSEGLSTPSKRHIFKAVATLEDLGMLERHDNGEKLTALGQRIVHFSTPPQLSKALVYASIFRCLRSVLLITASLTSGRDIFFNSIENRAESRAVKAKMNSTSDLLALLGVFSAWEELDNYKDKLDFCNDNNLSHRSIVYNQGISRVYAEHLYDGYLLNKEDVNSAFSSWNAYSDNNQLVLGMLLAGMGHILFLQKGVLSKGILRNDSFIIKTEDNKQVHTGSDSVLHELPKDRDIPKHILCINLTRDDVSRRTMARDLSLLHPLTVALFAGHQLFPKETDDGLLLSIDGREHLSFHVDHRTAKFLIELRYVMEETVNYLVETRGLVSGVSPSSNMLLFIDNLTWFISCLLQAKEKTNEIHADEENEDQGI